MIWLAGVIIAGVLAFCWAGLAIGQRTDDEMERMRRDRDD